MTAMTDIEARIAELERELVVIEEEMEALGVMGDEEACLRHCVDTRAEAVALLEEAMEETREELGILRERKAFLDWDWEGGDGMPPDEVTETFGSYAKMNEQFA